MWFFGEEVFQVPDKGEVRGGVLSQVWRTSPRCQGDLPGRGRHRSQGRSPVLRPLWGDDRPRQRRRPRRWTP